MRARNLTREKNFGVFIPDILTVRAKYKEKTHERWNLLGRCRQLGADALCLGLLLDELRLRDLNHCLDLIRPLEAFGHLVLAISTRAWVAKQEPFWSALESNRMSPKRQP